MFVRGDFEFLQRMPMTWDSVTYTWNQWVLGYNPERQRQFLANIGFSDATWQKLAVLLFVFAGLAVLAGALFAFRDLRRARNDAVRAAYERFCRKLARRGLPRHPSPASRPRCRRRCPPEFDRVRRQARSASPPAPPKM